MDAWLVLLVVTAGVVAGLGIFAVRKTRKQAEIRKQHPGYPQGYWRGVGMSVGIAIGVGVGVALGNIAIGTGMGVALGAAIGSGMERQHEAEIRPMVAAERELRRQSILVAIGTLVLGSVAFLIMFFVVR
jgi:hypothetical protein